MEQIYSKGCARLGASSKRRALCPPKLARQLDAVHKKPQSRTGPMGPVVNLLRFGTQRIKLRPGYQSAARFAYRTDKRRRAIQVKNPTPESIIK